MRSGGLAIASIAPQSTCGHPVATVWSVRVRWRARVLHFEHVQGSRRGQSRDAKYRKEKQEQQCVFTAYS